MTDLQPGVDYVVRDDGGPGWLPFPDVPSAHQFRHTWVLVRRRRPITPTLINVQGGELPIARAMSGALLKGVSPPFVRHQKVHTPVRNV